MKRIVMLTAVTAGVLAPATALAAEQTARLAVGNMYCASCPHIVQKSLTAVPGVSKVDVSYEQKSAVVTFDDQKANVQALIDAATKAGYPTKLVGQGS